MIVLISLIVVALVFCNVLLFPKTKGILRPLKVEVEDGGSPEDYD
ncbi:hypothetical protein [Zobellia uliginosa]|nr:hypothetical protein [Zobellia uliginosa]